MRAVRDAKPNTIPAWAIRVAMRCVDDREQWLVLADDSLQKHSSPNCAVGSDGRYGVYLIGGFRRCTTCPAQVFDGRMSRNPPLHLGDDLAEAERAFEQHEANWTEIR